MSIAAGDPSSADPTAVSAQQYSVIRFQWTNRATSQLIQSAWIRACKKLAWPATEILACRKNSRIRLGMTAARNRGKTGRFSLMGTYLSIKTQSSFNNLPNLKVGDKISIQSGAGANFITELLKQKPFQQKKLIWTKLWMFRRALKGLRIWWLALESYLTTRNATQQSGWLCMQFKSSENVYALNLGAVYFSRNFR